MTAVQTAQRFTRRTPCPICGGGHDDPHGQGVRCYAFLSSDGDYAHCTREEHAGDLAPHRDGTCAHRLTGDCACGRRHDPRPGAATTRPRDPGPVIREERYEARDPDGTLAAIKLRREHRDGSKRFVWLQPNGASGLNGRAATAMPLYGIERVQGASQLVVTEERKHSRRSRACGCRWSGR